VCGLTDTIWAWLAVSGCQSRSIKGKILSMIQRKIIISERIRNGKVPATSIKPGKIQGRCVYFIKVPVKQAFPAFVGPSRPIIYRGRETAWIQRI
jgi:hypothetical protein